MSENSGMSATETLTLIDDLRARGVLHFKSPHLEVVLGPLPEKEETEVDNPAKVKKVGKDGLTAEQQREAYGVSMNDTRE